MYSSERNTFFSVVIDEICLEGLEGITLPTLMIYVGKSMEFSDTLPIHFQQKIWSLVLKSHECLHFYELPVERETVKLFNRFENIDEDFGVPIVQDECKLVRYKYVPVTDNYVKGSCEFYKERQPISFRTLCNLSISDVLDRWGKRFVIVAKQELRYRALHSQNVIPLKELQNTHYCILEAIARSRANGETTSGAGSLQDFCKDSSVIFYIKKTLLRYNLVCQQVFNEMRNKGLHLSTLLTLPRFFKYQRSTLIDMVEQLFLLLKKTPEHKMLLTEVRTHFPCFKSQKSFRKIMLTHFFRQFFDIQSVPLKNVNKADATKSTQTDTNDKNANFRTVITVSLRNPNISIDVIYSNILDQELKSNPTSDSSSLTKENAYVDMPLEEEFYQCVASFGPRGCSQLEIYHKLSNHYLTIRQLVKKLTSEGLLKFYCRDFGRQRINMYVAKEHFDSMQEDDVSLSLLNNIQCSEEPNLPKEDINLSDRTDITARIKLYRFNSKYMQTEKLTQRLVQRKSLIIQTLNEVCLVSTINLQRILLEAESKEGLQAKVCRKSVYRLLNELSKQQIVNVYEIILQYHDQVRIHRYITHPKIDINHRVIQNEILKLKDNFHLCIEEKRSREYASFKVKLQESKVKNLIPLRESKPPKFLISRYLHEFLFHIIVGLKQIHTNYEIDKNLIKGWQLAIPEFQIKEFLEQLKSEKSKLFAYNKNINWRTFISPLPKYQDKTEGWMYFPDAVDRMPLSLFNKIVRIDKDADELLREYLNHPIRQHYLMRQLPDDLQKRINRYQMQRVYISVLKLLNHMGLIQIGERTNAKDPLVMWVYFNSRARLLDTTPSEMSYCRINPDRKYLPTYFKFNDLEDINDYWSTLQRFCVYTKLGFIRANKEKYKFPKQLEFLPCVKITEAPTKDVGYQPGDNLGAAGLSTNLFAHRFRNWSWSVQARQIHLKNIRTGRAIGSGVRKIIKLSKTHGYMKRHPQKHVAILKRKTNHMTCERKMKNYGPRDAIDRDALKNMRKLRVSWTKAEDEMLLIAKAAALYIAAPVLSLGSLSTSKVCRDIIRRTLGHYNKTIQSCSRRIQFLVKERRHIPQVPTWQHMLQINGILQQKYGDNFLQNLKHVYPQRSEYMDALLIHFILIMNTLYKLVYNTEDKLFNRQSEFILPDTLAEFEKHFCEHMPVQAYRDTITYKNPENEIELQTAVVIGVMHSSLCSLRDKALYNLQTFEIYKNFTEETLETAFRKAREDGLVVQMKRKNITLPSQLSGPAYILSSKYRLKLLFLTIPYNVYDTYYSHYESILGTTFDCAETSCANKNKCIELRSPTLGQMFVIAEGFTRQLWTSNIKLPVNVLTVDAEQSAKISPSDRILDHYHCLFHNGPKPEYTKCIENETNEQQIRVKFHPAILSYKVHYNPYDLINKLPQRHLHFFCALNHLNEKININFSKLQISECDGLLANECPFKCILKEDNYMDAIKQIVLEKRTILSSLSEIAPQKLLNMATSTLSVRVEENNLLTLVRMLHSFWYDKEILNERKDLGRMANKLRTKAIDWYQLCCDILSFNESNDDDDNADEYEPTLNKEDRLLRAQNVFVINLPNLLFTVNEKYHINPNKIVRNGVQITKELIEPELMTKQILKKVLDESLWMYTENDLTKIKEDIQQTNFNTKYLTDLERIHNYIEQYQFGVGVTDLMQEFPSEDILLECLEFLTSNYLIKRVGINTFMYTHKNHIRQWLVQTFNLKRLDRENIGGSTAALKRSYTIFSNEEKDKKEAEEEIPTKQIRLDGNNGDNYATRSTTRHERSPRLEKESDKRSTTSKDITTTIDREVIIMRPVPWIRLNGSVNRRVLDRWLGSILNECLVRSGCTVRDICSRFTYMVPADVMFLLEILSDLKCLYFIQMEVPPVGIFSTYTPIKERYVTKLYNPDCTCIHVCTEAIRNLCLFIGKKKYNAEFI